MKKESLLLLNNKIESFKKLANTTQKSLMIIGAFAIVHVFVSKTDK